MARDLFDRGNIMEYGRRGFRGGLNTLGDFRKFLLRGNVVDLAVGVVIGAAFNGVVQSAVKDLITPLIGIFVHQGNLSTLKEGPFLYGDFLNVVISFILTAAVVYFFVVKPINALHDRYERLRPKQEEAPTTRDCPFCLSEVPLKATRCAYCTAQLPPADETPAQAATAR
ncbi:large-conductance mechanosensitive channel [Dictyobacter sp. S3.2.2.5]|uniref:Large-conductance mechanosensitive channel n=1 Tax=Dictyobacter halimunensis TaxID=3026934 RepID=A0ABQ6FU52_9CHLR|nr:large-conductance mechanosensitive channel [Dictyobacter sp. S3.2.2.5]